MTMKIEKLSGTDKRFYELVAPFVMNPKVIRQNGNAAFKTSEHHMWYVAIDENDAVKGFIPMQLKTTHVEMNNYHIENKDPEILKQLVKHALKDFKKKAEAIVVIAHRWDAETISKLGFIVEKEWTNYIRYRKEL